MQSLVLATSLLLNSQNPIIATDVAQEIASFVQSETHRVTQVVHHKEAKALKNVFLQPNILIAKQKVANNSSTIVTAE